MAEDTAITASAVKAMAVVAPFTGRPANISRLGSVLTAAATP